MALSALVAKVFAQADPFLQAEAAIDGIRASTGAPSNAMTTVAEIITCNWMAGWPA